MGKSTIAEVKTKKKSNFKLPHLLFLMLGIIMFMSIMTYIIPAGEFAVDPTTKKNSRRSIQILGQTNTGKPVEGNDASP